MCVFVVTECKYVTVNSPSNLTVQILRSPPPFHGEIRNDDQLYDNVLCVCPPALLHPP